MEKPGWRKKADCIGRRWKEEEKEGRGGRANLEKRRGGKCFLTEFFLGPLHTCTYVVLPLLRKGCMNTGTQHSAHTHDPEERKHMLKPTFTFFLRPVFSLLLCSAPPDKTEGTCYNTAEEPGNDLVVLLCSGGLDRSLFGLSVGRSLAWC